MRFPPFDDSSLLRARPLDREVARGAVLFRRDDDGFVVDELPAYLPAGDGEHLYLHVEKRGLSTTAVVRTLQHRFRLQEREIGIAGRKDERGVTRQWISVPARAVEPHLEEARASLGFLVLEAKRHRNKLRLGHLRGNRFTMHLEGDIDLAALEARAALIAADGLPNLFGAQRFGIDGGTLEQAVRFLERERPARSRRDEMLVSAVQSSLFNAWLSDRVDDGSWNTPLDGDVLEKTLTGAPFVCTDPAVDEARVRAGEVCVAGPMPGRAMRSAEREALTRESRSWEKAGVDVVALTAHPAFSVGARRGACLRPLDLTVARLTPERPGVSLGFSLPKGAYASVVLRTLFGAALIDAAFADGPTAAPSDNGPQAAPAS